jgi:hypothetical protein
MDPWAVYARYCLLVAIGAAALVIDSGSLCSILLVVPGLVYGAVFADRLKRS